MNSKAIFLLLLIPLLSFNNFILANEKNTHFEYLPYCGISCLYAAMRVEGHKVDYMSLVKPDYIGSQDGSSFEELKQAAEDFGLHAVPLSRLTPVDLKGIAQPTILHVKSSQEKKEYAHFVLYLGSRNGKAVIFEPPAEKTLVDFGALVPKWDGNALVISSAPLAANEIASLSRKRLVIYAGFAVCVILAFHALKRLLPTSIKPRMRIGLSIGQAAGFALISVFIGLLCHFFYSGGFFANASAVAGVQEAHEGNFIPKVTPGKMQKNSERGDAIILDARLKRDYDVGHIDSAISLPINCSDEEYEQAISSVPKDKQIVLYCQSAGCKYAELIAVRLKEDGFKNLSVFKGGWVEWQKLHESQSMKAEGEKNDEEKVS